LILMVSMGFSGVFINVFIGITYPGKEHQPQISFGLGLY
jgi:hypothetical protein